MIANLHLITDVSEYVKYWKAKFTKHPMEEYTAVVNADVLDTQTKEFTPGDKFHMITGGLQEDVELRMQLHMRRLEQVVDIQEEERKETTFKRTCLFCRYEEAIGKSIFQFFDIIFLNFIFRNVFEGNSSELLNHMAFYHNFSVGQPNNLVFVHELIDLLEENLNKNVCIFCEKTFKTREVLKEHMRKKAHKKINPKVSSFHSLFRLSFLMVSFRKTTGKEMAEKCVPDLNGEN